MFASCLRRIRLGLGALHSGGALFGNFLKGLAGYQGRGLSGERLPAPNRNVDIGRVDFQGTGLAASSLRGNQDCAAAAKRVEDEVAPSGAVPDCLGDKANWLDCRVHLQFVHSLRAKRIDPGIVPDVGAAAPVLAKLEIIEVRSRSRLPDEDQFVLGAIETAHTAIGLIPDAEIFK